jgi:hypothetical protein
MFTVLTDALNVEDFFYSQASAKCEPALSSFSLCFAAHG